MSPKIKMYLVYSICFLVLFMLVWMLAGMFFEPDTWLRKLTPIIVSIVASPKPHIEQESGGNRYGLKTIFSKKIFWM